MAYPLLTLNYTEIFYSQAFYLTKEGFLKMKNSFPSDAKHSSCPWYVKGTLISFVTHGLILLFYIEHYLKKRY